MGKNKITLNFFFFRPIIGWVWSLIDRLGWGFGLAVVDWVLGQRCLWLYWVKFYSLFCWRFWVFFFFFLFCWDFWIWNLLEDPMIVVVVCGGWFVVGGGLVISLLWVFGCVCFGLYFGWWRKLLVVAVVVAVVLGSWLVATAIGLCVCILFGFWVNILFNVFYILF